MCAIMAMLVSAQAYAGQLENNNNGNTTPLHLYNPQKDTRQDSQSDSHRDSRQDFPATPEAQKEPAPPREPSRGHAQDDKRGPALKAESYLKHEGRIHYERHTQSLQSRHEAEDQGEQKNDPERYRQSGMAAPSRNPDDADLSSKKAGIKPPRKPDYVSESGQKDMQAHDEDKPAPRSMSTRTEDSSQMPAVPPGEIKKAPLKKADDLPSPSDESGRDPKMEITSESRDIDHALQDLMIRPETSELLASVDEVKAHEQQKAESQSRDDHDFFKKSGAKSADFRLIFKNGMRQLNKQMHDKLRKHVLPLMQDKPEVKLVIRSYATPSDTGQSSDRRIALARALKLRAFMMRNNLASDRMNIRALGDAGEKSPRDRIDLHITSP